MHTISQLLESAGCNFHIYEMGRQIQPIKKAEFNDIESLNAPYPAPIKGKAWFAVEFFEDKPAATPFIWFIHFSLDEFGLLVADQLNHFIRIIADAAGLTQQLTESAQQDNPYSFKPSLSKQAALNSIIRLRRRTAESAQLIDAKHYFLSNNSELDWRELSIQGIADLAARADKGTIENTLCQNYQQWSAEARNTLLSQLEHHQIGMKLAILLNKELTISKEPMHREQLIRALAGAPQQIAQQTVQQLTDSEALPSLAELIAIVGRHWQHLKTPEAALAVMEHLARLTLDSLELFNGVMADLLAIPGVREQVIYQMRNPETSATLRVAIGKFISSSAGH